MTRKIWFWTIWTIFGGVLFSPAHAQTYSPENLRNQKLILRETANNNRKVYVQVGNKEAYYIHDKSRLFPVRKPEPVIINAVNQKAQFTELVFTSGNLGKGKIRLYGASSTDLFNAAIRSALSESTDAVPTFVANKKSRFVHFIGSNHLPPEEDREPISEQTLESNNLVKCPLCFSNTPRVSGYDLEMRLSEGLVGQIHTRYPLVIDDEVQGRVRRAGEEVLSKWVTPLKGYNYKFYALDSELANAFACPGGKIYITNGLLESLESDEELEAVLAHEIAHVEMRHGYRQFRSLQKAAFWASLAAAVAAGLSNDKSYNAEMFNLVNLITQLAMGIVMAGHSRQYEAEADAFSIMYFESNDLGQGRTSFRNVLRKLQYHQDFYNPEKEGSSLFATHPGIDARIDAVEKSIMRAFGLEDVFYGYDQGGDLVATIGFQAQRTYSGTLNPDDVGLQVVALVETTSALGDKDQIRDIRIKTQFGTIKLDNKEDTEVLPNDAVGASFVSKSQRTLIDRIEDIDLKMRNVVRWQRN